MFLLAVINDVVICKGVCPVLPNPRTPSYSQCLLCKFIMLFILNQFKNEEKNMWLKKSLKV
jgi:hypothetical protein